MSRRSDLPGSLGGFAEWTDKYHLGVKFNGHTASFRTPEDKSSRLDAADGEKLGDFLRSAGVSEDMADGDGGTIDDQAQD